MEWRPKPAKPIYRSREKFCLRSRGSQFQQPRRSPLDCWFAHLRHPITHLLGAWSRMSCQLRHRHNLGTASGKVRYSPVHGRSHLRPYLCTVRNGSTTSSLLPFRPSSQLPPLNSPPSGTSTKPHGEKASRRGGLTGTRRHRPHEGHGQRSARISAAQVTTPAASDR
jgi:hypothetical protein